MFGSSKRELIRRINVLRSEFDTFQEHTVDAVNTQQRLRLELEEKVKHHEDVLNKLFTELGLEVYKVPEVPAVPAVPAHIAIRKAAQRDENGRFAKK